MALESAKEKSLEDACNDAEQVLLKANESVNNLCTHLISKGELVEYFDGKDYKEASVEHINVDGTLDLIVIESNERKNDVNADGVVENGNRYWRFGPAEK